MDWLFHSMVGFVLGAIPTWAWIILAGLAIGWAWKTFGTQGVIGALVAVVTLGAYRQGWRDRGAGKPPLVPLEDHEEAMSPMPRRGHRNVWSVQDILRGRND